MVTIAMNSIVVRNVNASTETNPRWYANSAPVSAVTALLHTNATSLNRATSMPRLAAAISRSRTAIQARPTRERWRFTERSWRAPRARRGVVPGDPAANGDAATRSGGMVTPVFRPPVALELPAAVEDDVVQGERAERQVQALRR
jgi:hypothetical protein